MRKLLMLFFLLTTVTSIFAQGRVVSGAVSDEKGTPLPGVSIRIKGSPGGALTSTDGTFSLRVPANAKVLQFTSLNMEPKDVALSNNSNTLSVTMTSTSASLQEVVVMGYQSVAKKDVVGPVSTIAGKEVAQKPIASFTQELQGKAPGVQVTGQSGRPGQNAFIRIRGSGSINASNEPLIIIDGLPVAAAAFSLLNPNDIETITILKDAASTSVYGARGANGVIVITTKRGKGKPELRYSFQYGHSKKLPLYNLTSMNAQQKLQYEYEGQYTNGLLDTMINNRKASGAFPAGATLFNIPEAQRQDLWNTLISRSSNWEDLLFQNAITKSHEIALSGAEGRIRYYFSLNSTDYQGILYASDFKRTGGRLNVEYQATDWFKLGTNLGVSFSKDNQLREPFNTQNTNAGFYLINPYEQARLANGNYNPTLQGLNPLEGTDFNPQQIKKLSSFSTIFGEAKFLKHLTVKSQLGINYNTFNEEYYLMPGSNLANILGYNQKRVQANQDYLLVYTNTANWTQTLGGKHTFSLLGGMEFNKDKVYNIQLIARGFPTASVNTLDNASTPNTTSTSRSDWSLISYFANGSYDYKKKYFITLSARRDGSSRFGKDVQFANFGGVGLAWDIKSENFIKWGSLSSLRVRASYGTAGNNNIGNYDALGTYALNARYNNQGAAIPARLPNPELTWETNKNYDFGLDAAFFNNRLTFRADYYNRKTQNLLYPVNVSATTGFTSYTGNIGGLVNKGYELSIGGDIIRKKDFTWNVSVNYTNNDNKITQLYNDNQVAANTGSIGWLKVGEAINTFKLVQYAGVDPQTGKDQYYKKDGTITTTFPSSEAVLLSGKSPNIKYFGSINTSINYKNFDLSAQFYYSGGNYIMNYMWQVGASNGESINIPQFTEAFNYWKKPGDVVPYANLNDPTQNQTFDDTRWLQKGDYLSLRDVTLGYNLEGSMLSHLKILKGLRLYVQGTNLLMFTKFKGQPEVGLANGESAVQPGVYNLYAYPQFRSVTFGIDVKF
ncbi:MAG: TonB-dependent receptor SusC [Chitinophagaceae bacterium]|nr:TonB-dependent receptor SusC [Chitinophagaceae bacterium]